MREIGSGARSTVDKGQPWAEEQRRRLAAAPVHRNRESSQWCSVARSQSARRREDARQDRAAPGSARRRPRQRRSMSGAKSQSQARGREQAAGRAARLQYGALGLLDAAFSAAVVGPAVVGYWRGTWALSGLYIQPAQDPRLGCLAAVLLGFCGLLGFSLGQRRLARLLRPGPGPARRALALGGSRAYTYVFGFCCVNAWRGAWQALDLYTEHSLLPVAGTTGLSLLALGLMRTLRNISAPPFAISLDGFANYFEASRDWALYALDCAFSVGVVGTLVVFVWRGAWALLDLYLFPESREHSAVGSLVVGYALVGLAFSAQPLARRGCARLQGLRRLLLADLFLLLSFLGTVNVWRGIWNALDLYLLPGRPQASCWLSHVGCFLLLVLLNCSNSVLVRGVYIDGEEQGGRCVAFPCHYLRLLLQEERRGREAAAEPGAKQPEGDALLAEAAAAAVAPAAPEAAV
ncbi:uncharacterized protein LOC131671072 isoform X2 [Phymastichus coffea]|uniref:uncharacterized protein LOC131671072 isoform X2 n=1 Tax=Phymastichus coffea TaxID=108790 RepID=UPI00273C0EBC|nr:uncharacterized protein LOC131671072 isoform X2 [Phymastichus coffea]